MIEENIAGLTLEGTVHQTLGIRTLEAGVDRVVLELDVGPAVHQPMGLLHGGVSAVLAESAASMGAYANCDTTKEYAVGIDLNISHLRGMSSGTLKATAEPIRKGTSVHVWSIVLEDERARKVAIARCTLVIRPWETLKS